MGSNNEAALASRAAGLRKFVIVLPVRNGGAHFKGCVRSILAQSYQHFRLVVLDNASTDDTVRWVRTLADPRIAVHESPVPLDIEDNWARVSRLEMPDEFLTIIGHDDLLDADYLSSMSALIDEYPDANLYQAHFRLIDANGRTLRPCLPMPPTESPQDFLAARLRLLRDSYGTGYMCRAADYRRVGGIPPYKKLMFADDALWMALMRGSYKATAAKQTFSYRLHAGGTSHSPDWRATFDSLGVYLAFLIEYGDSNAAVADVLSHGIADYMLFWFRWAYFTARRQPAERPQILEAIASLSAELSPIIGPSELARFGAQTQAALFGALPGLRWFLWQVARYVRIRFLRR